MKPTKEYNGRSRIRMFNMDCMDFMKQVDKPYDLAIVDPPYMDNIDEYMGMQKRMGGVAKTKVYENVENFSKPNEIYFGMLKILSDNQIIWGVNHYETYFGCGRIIWDKNVSGVYNDAELAYHSFSNAVKIYEFTWNGMLQGNMKNKEHRIHPTQKPVQLYKWLLTNYAKQGDTILDTHGGSMSIAIACWDLGFDLDIIELDEDYFNDAVKRFENHISQTQLF